MSDVPGLFVALLVAVVITVALRATPFVLRDAMATTNALDDLRRWMPLGAVAVLTVYCLRGVDLGDARSAVPQLAGVLATVAVHRWRSNAVWSIVVGTAVCLVLVNTSLLG